MISCRQIVFALIFLSVLFIFSANAAARETGGAGEPETPARGDRIITASLGEPSNLIPPLSTDTASKEASEYLYVAPLKYDKDLNIIPWAAESFEVLEDGKLLSFKLRPGIMWDDGRELTAEDVEFTYKFMIDPRTPTAYAEDFKAVSSFKVTGRYSFEVRYDQPFARSQVTWMSAILPRHALEGQDPLNTPLSRKPLSAGPYRLDDWVTGTRLNYSARDDYFEGRANIDAMVTRIIPDTATMFMELKAGNLDMMNLSPQQYLQQTAGRTWQEDFNKYKYLSFAYIYMGYNLNLPLFKDARVRRALAMAIDKDELVQAVLLGLGEPTIGPYKPHTWPYNESIVDYPFDPAAAEKLLAEAGWSRTDKSALLTDKDGRPFSFTLLTNQGNDQRIKTATVIQRRLREIGVEVKIRTVEWAVFLKEFLDKGRFEAVIMGWTIPQDPDLYDVWHSSKATEGQLNFIGYKNPELDALLERGRRTLDPAKRKPIYDQAQKILHEDQPYCFLYVPYELPIVQARFHGIEPSTIGITYNFIDWWVPEKLQRKVPSAVPLKN